LIKSKTLRSSLALCSVRALLEHRRMSRDRRTFPGSAPVSPRISHRRANSLFDASQYSLYLLSASARPDADVLVVALASLDRLAAAKVHPEKMLSQAKYSNFSAVLKRPPAPSSAVCEAIIPKHHVGFKKILPPKKVFFRHRAAHAASSWGVRLAW